MMARRHIMQSRTSSVASPIWYFFSFRCKRLASERAKVVLLIVPDGVSSRFVCPLFIETVGETLISSDDSTSLKNREGHFSFGQNRWNFVSGIWLMKRRIKREAWDKSHRFNPQDISRAERNDRFDRFKECLIRFFFRFSFFFKKHQEKLNSFSTYRITSNEVFK